ncbi:hypothetical protein DFQ29_001918 [Apophysomyces sp. BC1021]|nr:hypothetical protein DFQ29_001918 [Apophysomyces sp. BC1021]
MATEDDMVSATAIQEIQQPEGLVADIVQSIMTPGHTPKGVIQLMFYAFYALFVTLGIMVVMTGFNGHVIALLLLSLCLFLTIRWFVAEMERMDRNADTPKKKSTGRKRRKAKKRGKKH